MNASVKYELLYIFKKNKNKMFGSKEERLKQIDEEFYRTVNRVIAEKITPLYNTCILIFAAVFAYFIVIEQP